jgi:hypothetical protein
MALLIVDASLSHRLAKALRERGRESVSVKTLEMADWKDPPLLRELFSRFPDGVLVTGDYDMPMAHADVVSEVGETIAAIQPLARCRHVWQSRQVGVGAEEAYKREVVHRWAHRMAEQELRTCRKYGLRATGEWTARTR